MTDIAIRVKDLSKQYHIGGPQARYKTIRALWNRPPLQKSELEYAVFHRAGVADRGSAGTFPPSILRRPQSGVREDGDTDADRLTQIKKRKSVFVCVNLCPKTH